TINFIPPHAPSVNISSRHLDFARNTFELCPVDTAGRSKAKLYVQIRKTERAPVHQNWSRVRVGKILSDDEKIIPDQISPSPQKEF
ncbi:MAG: hypothetical protein ABL917_03460, partial [Parcubacteria group bacterium]